LSERRVDYVLYNEIDIELLKGVISMFGLVKGLGQVVISLGVGTIITNVVKATTPAVMSTFSRACVAVAGSAVAFMVGEKTVNFIEEQIVEAWDDRIKIDIEPKGK